MRSTLTAAGTLIATAPPRTRAEALMRRGVFLIGLAALAAVAVLAMTAFRGPDRIGPLDWTGKTDLFTHPTLPGDRILTGMLRNDGEHPLRVDIGDVRLLASDGTTVPSNAVFLQTSGKTLWAAGRGLQTRPDTELQRTGRITMLRPGEEVPLTIAWHAKDGKPARVDYGDGSLSIPG